MYCKFIIIIIYIFLYSSTVTSQTKKNQLTLAVFNGVGELILTDVLDTIPSYEIIKEKIKVYSSDAFIVYVSDTLLQGYVKNNYIIYYDLASKSIGWHNKLSNEKSPKDLDSVSRFGYVTVKDSSLNGTWYLINNLSKNYELVQIREIKNCLLDGRLLKFDFNNKLESYDIYSEGYPADISLHFDTQGFISSMVVEYNCIHTKYYSFEFNKGILRRIKYNNKNLYNKIILDFDETGKLSHYYD